MNTRNVFCKSFPNCPKTFKDMRRRWSSRISYADRFEDDGSTIIYEGHDLPRSPVHPNPKAVDQPEFTPTEQPTENGKFHSAAQQFKSGHRPPERIRVYEKIKQGIWSYNGVFHLVDSWQEMSNGRSVFKFKLAAVEGEACHPDVCETRSLETGCGKVL